MADASFSIAYTWTSTLGPPSTRGHQKNHSVLIPRLVGATDTNRTVVVFGVYYYWCVCLNSCTRGYRIPRHLLSESVRRSIREILVTEKVACGRDDGSKDLTEHVP